MDPDETLRLIDDAVCSQDFEDAAEHSMTLLNWLERGGYTPCWAIFMRGEAFYRDWACHHRMQRGY